MTSEPRLRAEVAPNRERVEIRRMDGDALLTHRLHPGQRPSLHPIRAPAGGGILTEDAPSHHPWQHGLYTGFNLVNGIGFWKESENDGTFQPALVSPPVVSGATAQWSVEAAWQTPGHTVPLTERQDWTLTDEDATFDLEVIWTLRALVDVEIGQYMAGGLFLRMPFSAERGGVAVNSEGQRNGDAERQRARWVTVSMPIAGRSDWCGFAAMDHPGNPGFPVTWRVDNELGISPSRCIAGSWTIAAGTSERYRYRLHVFCGSIDPVAIDHRWQRFAETGTSLPS